MMNQNIELVDMKEEYLPAVLDIYNYYVLNSTATFHTEPLTLEGMRNILFFNNNRFRSFLIIQDEVVSGYCILAPYKNREAYDTTAEATIYLKHGNIGRGIGREALKFLEEQAKSNEFHSLLAVICGENKESINLFEGSGYEKCAHYKDVGKKFDRFLDVVCYQKMLE